MINTFTQKSTAVLLLKNLPNTLTHSSDRVKIPQVKEYFLLLEFHVGDDFKDSFYIWNIEILPYFQPVRETETRTQQFSSIYATLSYLHIEEKKHDWLHYHELYLYFVSFNDDVSSCICGSGSGYNVLHCLLVYTDTIMSNYLLS